MKGNIMKKFADKVKKYPHTTLAVIAVLGAGAIVQTVRLQLSQLTTYQIVCAAEDLGLDQILTDHLMSHEPYHPKTRNK
jgi:uridylate kinase